MNSKYALNPHALVRFLEKDAKDFTKEDIIRYVTENGIEMINFRYPGADGRLKTLNFIINSLEHLDNILTSGERVDGSSLFPYIEAGSSDLYVLPRYRTAFLNPFSEIPAVDILCSFYTKDGKPLELSPEYTMRKAHEALKRVTGMEYEVMGELEYYVVSEKDDLFLASDQKGYHESTPFNKGRDLRALAMKYIAGTGGLIKYGHSEVGNFTKGDLMYEQNEIEFLPTKMEDAADQLIIAKWILRTLAYQFGVDLTFAPKITVGKAGSGLHIHTRLKKGDKNMMIENGKLTGNYVGDIVDGKRKAELLRLIAQVEKVDIAQTIAVGDGANDLPMLGVAGLGIAFHAKPKVVANAKQSINTIGLDGVLYFLGFKDSYLNM